MSPWPSGLRRSKIFGLKAIGVLIFVNENMVEPVADGFGDLRISHHLRPEQQQVIVIDDVLFLLDLCVGGKKIAKIVLPLGHTRETAWPALLSRVCPN